MPRPVVWALLAALGCVAFAAAPLRAQPIDQWHYIDPDSVLHTDYVEGLQGAGIIQSDQIFALLYLGLPGENGVVSVVLPSGEAADTLVSTLIKSDGGQFRRELTDEELDIAPTSDVTFAYSFVVTEADLKLFKSALTWRLEIGQAQWDITLRGSRKSIEKAEREQARLIAALSAKQTAQPASGD